MAHRLLDLARLEAATFEHLAEPPSRHAGPAALTVDGLPREVSGSVPRIDGAGSVSALHAEVSHLALLRPVVVVVDDLQWCDAPSAAALIFLARRTVPGRILLLASTSPHSARQDSGAADELMAEPNTRVLHLRTLPPERVSRLVHQEVPQPPPALVEACQATTGGNPFLLLSLLAELRRHPVPDLDAYATAIDTLAPRWWPGPFAGDSRPRPTSGCASCR